MGRGRVVVLNGPSSAGKTTLAHAVRDRLGLACIALSVDRLYAGVHEDRVNDWELFRALSRATVDQAASLAGSGFDVVVDTVFERTVNVEDLETALAGFDVFRVGLFASVEVLEARERARRNRPEGWARGQAERVHGFCTYDLEIDTGERSLDGCVDDVVRMLEGG